MVRINAMSNHSYHHLIEESKRYYPEIHDHFFNNYTCAFRDMLMKAMNYAKDNNYLRPNVDIETTVDFICRFVQAHRISETADSGEYNSADVDDAVREYAEKMSEISFTFLRGLMSTDTIIRYEKKEGDFKKIMNLE